MAILISIYDSCSLNAVKLQIGQLYLLKKYNEPFFFLRVINFLTHSN